MLERSDEEQVEKDEDVDCMKYYGAPRSFKITNGQRSNSNPRTVESSQPREAFLVPTSLS